MGLLAERGAQRMQARQTYRTMARMQRRRSFVQSRLGTKEDFSSREEPVETAAPTAQAASEPEYVGELGLALSGAAVVRAWDQLGEFVIDTSTPGRPGRLAIT
jgi:hypothetical protein